MSLPLSPPGNILFIIYSPSLLARDRLLYKRTNLDNIYSSTYLYIFFLKWQRLRNQLLFTQNPNKA